MADYEDKIKAAFDAEFERTRPRPGLRGRVIATAVGTPRTRRRGFGAWLTPPRLALAGAAAAVLVVAGVGFRVATQSPPVATKPTAPPSVLAWGKLPAPQLQAPQGLGGGGGDTAIPPYYGPATMTWSGPLPKVPASAPVYRFKLPTVADADAFAARLGAKLVSAGSPPEARTYRLPGFQLFVALNDAAAGEPTWGMNTTAGSGTNRPYTEDAARQAADAELAKRGLTPTWKASVQVTRFQAFPNQPVYYIVEYQRVIPLPDGNEALEVDSMGDPAGIQVMVDTQGHVVRMAGILRLSEESAAYPLRAPSTAVSAAVSASPATSTGIDSGPPPTVALNKVTLVYTTVSANGVGYMEPAYLFTGIFERGGHKYEKRVLVPALATRAIGPQ
jgi:hypothetical protein